MTTIYVSRQPYSHCIGPFFSSPDAARAYYLERYRHAMNAADVAEQEVRALVAVHLDTFDEIEIDCQHEG